MDRALAAGLILSALLAAADGPAPSPSPASAPTAGQIRGSIIYGRHAPAVGAIVVVRPEGVASPVHAATTGTSGTFAFDGLPDGLYRADVRRDGYVPLSKTGILVRAPFRAVVELQLARGETPREDVPPAEGPASLTGTIRIAGGGPLGEAHVRLTRMGGPADARTTDTDAQGGFSCRELAAGRWRLEVQGAGLLPMRALLDLAGDVRLEAQLAAQPADYHPLPQDLLVPEEALPPPGS
jgi:hypothetical protein